MGAEIEYEGGWLRRGGWCRWRLAVALAFVVAGVLWAAGPASAASRKWTVLNHTFHDLRLEDVKHVEGAPFGFEGRPDKGSILDAARPDVLSKPEPPTAQHFELKWGPDYEAVLIYKIYPTDLFVQFWIKNALDFSDSRCIISHLPYVSTRWAFSYAWPQKEGDVLYELVCRAHISRHVEFYDKVIGSFPTAPLPRVLAARLLRLDPGARVGGTSCSSTAPASAPTLTGGWSDERGLRLRHAPAAVT